MWRLPTPNGFAPRLHIPCGLATKTLAHSDCSDVSRGASQEAPDHPLGALLAVGHVGEHVPGEGCELRDDAQQREELHLVRVRVGVRVRVRVALSAYGIL